MKEKKRYKIARKKICAALILGERPCECLSLTEFNNSTFYLLKYQKTLAPFLPALRRIRANVWRVHCVAGFGRLAILLPRTKWIAFRIEINAAIRGFGVGGDDRAEPTSDGFQPMASAQKDHFDLSAN